MHVLTVSIIVFCWIVWIAHWNDTNSYVKHRYETKIIQKKTIWLIRIVSEIPTNYLVCPSLVRIYKLILVFVSAFQMLSALVQLFFFSLQLAYSISLHQMIDAIHESNSKANLIDLKAISFWRNHRILDWWLDTIFKLKYASSIWLLGLCIWHFI